MKKVKENLLPLLLLLLMPGMSYLYTIINRKATNAHDISTKLDTLVPFVKIFILPYMFWHIFIPFMFIILCLKDKRTYFKTMFIYLIGCTISNIIFTLYQTTMIRPPLIGSGFPTNLMRIVYGNDNPVNCFPSIHVFTSYLMIRAVSQSKLSSFYNNLITSILGTLIILSTMFVKQHGVLDVAAGIFIAEVLARAVNYFEADLLLLCNKKLFSKISLKQIFNRSVDNEGKTKENYHISE